MKVPKPLPVNPDDPPGMDCFADDRDALNDYAKYFNNSHLSDVSLLVGEEIFPAHRIVLCKSSEVFDRMLSTKWNGDKKEMELVEDPHCQKVFAAFLRFLYCNHLVLNPENALPLLVLADKYNVHGLKKVCLEYAVNYILPELSLKDLFHVWYSYATKAYHQVLIHACIQTLARDFEVIITSEDWEKEWMAIDRDQLIELLKSNELVLRNEFILWQAILKWMSAPNHPERRGNTASPLLVQLLPLIRFPFMSGDDLSQVEKVPVVESQARLFHPQMLLAYKFQALPLASRVSSKEFMGTQFLLRNYTDVGWAKRFTVSTAQLYDRNIDHCFTFKTRSSTFPQYSWNWIFKFSIQTYPNAVEEARVSLMTEDIDQPRSVEYLLAVVDEKKVLRSLAGKKTFTKTRYCTELDLQKQITVTELFSENSPLLSNGNLNLQLILKPID
ncbi:hypothetical protein QR680_004919 [Steinernema hermaphroditum]|uniref:BTB domain-containing protein n=1 Tax=Steinernema hermaphroditum TaxID=289476 RepID=A0AA39LTZ4_9BILA|nr:hypothetical protein QR680_004919 [Steinernema hermaphroditum]